MISVHFQGKSFNITVIQICAPTNNNAEEAEAEQFYEDLQDFLELTSKKDALFIVGDWNAKVGSQEIPVRMAIIKMAILVMQTINVRKNVEKREPSYTLVGNPIWYSHYDEQNGIPLKS